MVNTKSAPRRALKFSSLDELTAELDRLDAAHAAGKLGHTGNWTPAQILDHLARFWACSLDGFPGRKPPLPLRVVVRLFFKKKAIAGGSPPPGFKLPKEVSFLLPGDAADFDSALANLRACIDRVNRGGPYIPASPLFGKLTEGQWTLMHLGHCSMHLSFISLSRSESEVCRQIL